MTKKQIEREQARLEILLGHWRAVEESAMSSLEIAKTIIEKTVEQRDTLRDALQRLNVNSAGQSVRTTTKALTNTEAKGAVLNKAERTILHALAAAEASPLP